MKIKAEIENREWVEIDFSSDDQDRILKCSFKTNGCHNLISAADEFSKNIVGQKKQELKWNKGSEHWNLLIEELILRLNSKFELPYKEEELCHCRKVPTLVVDRMVVLGAHSTEKVRAWCSATSGCGTCKDEVEKMISYRVSKTNS